MIPSNIQKSHLLAAIAEIDRDGIPAHQESTRYDLAYNGKLYPPKLVVRIANRLANGEELWNFGGGEETNNFLRRHGFEIINRSNTEPMTPQEQLIARYKALKGSETLQNERYKWALIRKFQDTWNLDAPDLAAMIRKADFSNLVYPMAKSALVFMAENAPDEIRSLFQFLYNETVPLSERLQKFSVDMENLHLRLSGDPKIHAYQDERQMATYLAFRYPDRYYLYKDSFYSKYCRHIGVKKVTHKNAKYLHYLELMNDFRDNYIIKDKELLQMAREQIKGNDYSDPEHRLLTQDVAYVTMETAPLVKQDQEKAGDTHAGAAHPLNTILYGPPGTGKTYSTIELALRIVDPGFFRENSSREAMKQRFNDLMEMGHIAFITFHQSTSYEDFIEGIKPVTVTENSQDALRYQVEKGVFWKISDRARLKKREFGDTGNHKDISFSEALSILKAELESAEEIGIPIEMKTKGYYFYVIDITDTHIVVRTQENNTRIMLPLRTIEDTFYEKRGVTKHGQRWYIRPFIEKLRTYHPVIDAPRPSLLNHVLIIDEINRGNIAQVFGELITLLEEDKRDGREEHLGVTLTYSQELFTVPDNLYIIGTMNTADRSVEALDTALRRRFSFVEMPPKPELLEPLDDLDLQKMLETINYRLEVLLDRDHRIGHAYFMGIYKADDPLEALKMTFQKNVIPLLQEYFYGDYSKIGAVLGTDFVEKAENRIGKDTFAKGAWDIDAADYRPVYRLKDVTTFTDTTPFINIYATR